MTNPINHPPTVAIRGPATLYFGQDATFTADRSDPDDDPLTLTWRWAAGRCPGDVSQSTWPSGPRNDTETFTLPSSSLTGGPVCVWAFVTDSHGATTATNREVEPQDRHPEARLALVTPATPVKEYPLYTHFEVSADGSTDPDGDKVTPIWQPLQVPTGSTATLVPCPTATSEHRCFDADVPGSYLIGVTAKEDIGGRGPALSSTPTTTLMVDVAQDAMPCLRSWMPLADKLDASPDERTDFSAGEVDDDGPASEIDYRWYLTDDASGATTVYPKSFSSYPVLPGRFAYGNTATVRLEIRDRDQARMANWFAECKDTPKCEHSPGCFQRVTWTITFGLPGAM